jgi:hypothetical protein
VNPIAVALSYCKLFTSITSIFLLNHFTIIQVLIWEFEYFLYRLILFLSIIFPSALVNPMFIASYQISSRHHLDPCLVHLNLFCLIQIYSNCNCATWVGYEFFINYRFYFAIVVWNQFYYHSSWSYFIMFNEPFELCSQMSIIHTQSYAYLILFTCIELFNLQMS